MQGSDAWFIDRLGKVTASALYKVMAKTKTGYGVDRANYHAQLVAERLTGSPTNPFCNPAMQWGSDTEPQARAMYALETGLTIIETDFWSHPSIEMTGASPDGLVGNVGLVEIKCPNTATHIATLTGKPIEQKYLLQMQWQMACTGREWCDFASFDPRLPGEMQLHVQRIVRDDELLAELECEVLKFLAEVDQTIRELTKQYRKAA